jgi:hypothetical protein
LLIARETLTAEEFAALRPVADKEQARGLAVDIPARLSGGR